MLAHDRRAAIMRALERRGSATITDLADELGVSSVTVRQDVRDLADRQLLTRVHGGVRSLAATKESLRPATGAAPGLLGGPATSVEARVVLGLVVPTGSYYYAEVARGAQAAARELGVRVALAVSRDTVADNRQLVEQMLADGVQGLLAMFWWRSSAALEVEQWLDGLPVPVMLMERRAGIDSTRLEHVASDHSHGAYQAVRHLAGLGHERVALVARDDTATAPLLAEGFEAAVRALRLKKPWDYPIAAVTDPGVERDGRFDELLDQVQAGRLGAAVVHNDMEAIALVGLARQRGLRVPHDFAVVAYDDEVAEMSDIPLTAVAPPKRSVGAWAVRLLVHRLREPDAPRAAMLLRPELHVRRSTVLAFE